MKELSIEEKAKRYDRALEKARQLCAYPTSKPFISDLQDLFPELAESEDERMLRVLREGFNILDKDEEWYSGITNGQILAWLEKQGNLMKALQISNAKIGELIEKNYYLKEQLEKQSKNNMGISESTKKKLEDNLNKALEKETPESWNEFLDEQSCKEENLKERNICDTCEDSNGCLIPCCAKLLEKQGEQKPVFEMKTPEESLGIDSDTYNKIVDECVYGEQKFKIEEGKWYVCTQTYVLRGKIVVIKGQTYQAEKDNVVKGEGGCLFIDRHDGKASDYFRSWTIQDVKDGDILYSNQIIILFKQWEDNTDYSFVIAHAGIDISGKLQITNEHWLISNKSKPATREQRDLLFQKMKESGYEWDAEKKELKKIEEKKDIYNKLTAFEFSLKHIIEEAIECGDIRNLKADADLLLRIAQKTSWSEEDEDNVNKILCICDDFAKSFEISPASTKVIKEDVDKIDNWLKSLKDRVQLQNGYNPYKEVVESIAEMCKHYDKASHSSLRYFYDNVKVKCKDAKEYESLFPQSQWKPSDEQMNALNDVISSRDIKYDVLSELWKDLKKVKG